MLWLLNELCKVLVSRVIGDEVYHIGDDDHL